MQRHAGTISLAIAVWVVNILLLCQAGCASLRASGPAAGGIGNIVAPTSRPVATSQPGVGNHATTEAPDFIRSDHSRDVSGRFVLVVGSDSLIAMIIGSVALVWIVYETGHRRGRHGQPSRPVR